jgi:hypothetical protein
VVDGEGGLSFALDVDRRDAAELVLEELRRIVAMRINPDQARPR